MTKIFRSTPEFLHNMIYCRETCMIIQSTTPSCKQLYILSKYKRKPLRWLTLLADGFLHKPGMNSRGGGGRVSQALRLIIHVTVFVSVQKN